MPWLLHAAILLSLGNYFPLFSLWLMLSAILVCYSEEGYVVATLLAPTRLPVVLEVERHG